MTPKLLAKYYGLDNLKHILCVISRNQLYFSDATKFNDPFEMNPALLRTKKFKRVKVSSRPISDFSIRKVTERYWNDMKARLSKNGVCCFSEVCNDITMWSHYADKHKGICMLFSTENGFFKDVVKVQYVPTRPIMKIFPDPSWREEELAWTKMDMWGYEKEWRLFRRRLDRSYKYPKSSLKGIIFGCRCVSEDREIISGFVRGKKVKFYEAGMSLYDYEIQVKEIPRP